MTVWHDLPARALGNTGLRISRIGCGGWQLGGGELPGPRAAEDDARRVATVTAALDAGINWIDTAAVYGLGHSERIVARVLREVQARPFIFSKCGYVWDDRGRITQCLKPDSLRRGLETSLRRLEVEAIDLYQIHWPVPDDEIEEAWAALLGFRDEGKVRHVGVSNFSVDQIGRCAAIAPVESCQPPFSLAHQAAAADVLPYCDAHKIGVIVYSPQASGLLTGAVTRETVAAFAPDDDRRDDPTFKEPALTRSLNVFDRLSAVGAVTGLRPGSLAIAGALANPAVTAAIVGFDDPGQVGDAVLAASERERFESALRNAGLLRDPR